MKPRGALMIEHRLIEKILNIAGKELENIRREKKVDPVLVDTMVDFIKTYADRTHHGKEEDILFKELERKELNQLDRRLMQDLVNEHINARNVVKELVEANKNYAGGDQKSLATIIEKISFLIHFYPEHITKEDKVFFPDTEKYFRDNELDKMLDDFWEFDRRMIHEKYEKLYAMLSKKYDV